MHSTCYKSVDYPLIEVLSMFVHCSTFRSQSLHMLYDQPSFDAPNLEAVLEENELYEMKHPHGLKISGHTLAFQSLRYMS